MKPFTKKQRDAAMRIICDFYARKEPRHSIGPDFLRQNELLKYVDTRQLVEVLQAMGYLSCQTDIQDVMFHIELTDAGKCYFERKMDLTREKRIEWIRYIITTAIAVLALVLAGISLAAQLHLIQLPGA